MTQIVKLVTATQSWTKFNAKLLYISFNKLSTMEGTKFSLESETYLRYLHKQCEKYPLYCRSYGFLMETSEPVCDVCKRLSIYRASLFCDQRFKWNSRMLRRGAEWIWTLENN